MNKNVMLKSLFKVRMKGFEDEQAKLDRYYKYFAKMDKKQNDLIQDIHAKCSEIPSIDVDLKSMVDNLYELTVGDVNG